MAISAYRSKKIRSKSRASAIFGVPKSTLLDRLKGINPRSETRANGHKLTVIEEEVLVKQVLDADKRGFPIRPEYLRGMAHTLLRERTRDSTAELGVNWAYKFVNRHDELRTRYNRRITYQRAKQEDPRVIQDWFETVQAAIKEHGIHEDDIWNFDETGFAMGLCSTSKVITAAERSERPRTVIQGNREWVTILESISSKGIHIPPLIILKASTHQAAWYQEPTLPKDWWIATSENGWTTDTIGLHWLKEVFEPQSRRYSTGAKRLLILDGHSSHLTADFDIFCKENAIICLCMPPHTSHLLQPLDVGVFGPLKRAYGKLLEGIMTAGNNHIDKEDFLSLYPPAREKVFNARNIYSGFAGTGLKPIDADRVLAKITFQLRTPTPPLVEDSSSSAVQTPQNLRQLDHKVRSLRKSLISRKLSSSPMSHIRHLEKAAQMAMNVNNLLQEEIRSLRAENERKVRKKARKHANIGNDTILNVQEGRDRVQQLNEPVDEQLDLPSTVRRQRAPPRCSGCNTIGHNIRNCPNK
jgi:DDE superfamily endonuclease/Tc5 transposase-like DNA-binding protein/Psq-like protein